MMHLIKNLITICLCLFCCQEHTRIIVESSLESSRVYTVEMHVSDFQKELTLQSKWDGLIKHSDSDQDLISLYHKKKEAGKKVSTYISSEYYKSADTFKKTIVDILGYYCLTEGCRDLNFQLTYDNKGNLLGLTFRFRFKEPLEESFFIPETACSETFRAVSDMHIISPWDEKDFYWASFGGRLTFSSIE